MKNSTGKMAAQSYALLTIDVWDTLLRRRCHPDSVKLQVCRYVALNYAQYLHPENQDIWVLLRLRQQAEKELGDESRQAGQDDEYRHREVYRRWLALAGLTPFPVNRETQEQLLLTLERVEMAQEKLVSYPDPTIAAILEHYPVSRRCFLSDFYLPAAAIQKLLTHHGLSHWAAEGVVSCEVGLNKRSGRLYQHLHQHFGVTPGQHLHVGDNAEADVRAAKRMGVAALHFQPRDEHEKRRQREASFHARAEALQTASRDLLAIPPPFPCERQEIYDYGRKCSLLLVGFTAWIMERAVVDQVKELYFFTREGEFFIEIYRRLVKWDWLGFSPPSASVLPVSRLATFAASLKNLSTAELMRLWNQYSTQSLGALLKSLGLEPVEFTERAARHGLELTRPIPYPWQDTRIQAFLDDPKVSAEIEAHLKAKQGQLSTYLESMGLENVAGSVGIVDIGWRGTIQDNLAHLLPSVALHGYYLGLNRFLNIQPENIRKEAFGPNLNKDEGRGFLLDFVAPLEMLCNSPSGSVIGYEEGEHSIRVCRHTDEEENRIYDAYVRHFQAGVLDAVPFWVDFLRTHAYPSSELQPLAMDIWSDIIQHPPPFLAQAYFQLNHNETFGMGGFSNKRRMLTTGEVLGAFISRKQRTKLHEFLRDNGWVPGLLACPDVDSTFRWVLGKFLWALGIRRWVRRRFFSSL
ncbi:HAD family hydrolase [Nitrosococcus oceani]|uniref:Haloacid dehalogenase n=1 Tax=Nitrosococcus oceani C-27 TaxID=314279 RepID=A0A0E2YZY9_9GAMM|nr:HAD family hydrolase [Nitrosococcus oceani]EDZ67550.1 haloacid dehalogenase-like hydrolase domain protein [Nitrosococcus oceani AFC27]KFI18933.1 haloacid dehalogenase [Nitrosococcus oceani C-27]KFI22215.1 haloacid dehalogenase [Nitrosococcus oceani]